MTGRGGGQRFGLPPGPRQPSWFARHKVLTVLGVVVGLFVVLGGIGAAVGDGSTGSGKSNPVAAATEDTTRGTALDPASELTAGPTASAGQATAPPSAAGGQRTASPSAPRSVAVPSVVGQRLDAATRLLTAAGLAKTAPTDGTGQNRVVVNPTNWVVQAQKPAAGARIAVTQLITLIVLKPSDSSAGGPVNAGVMPNVVCKDLQAAQDTLQAAGFHNLGSEDGTGQGRAQLVHRNWVVIKQPVGAGSSPEPTTRVMLTAVKYGEPTGSSGCPR